MRDDDDNIRLYAPLVRRIMVLVAVVVAVPVVLWTITAFMRTYVGPPRLPTFRPIAAAAMTPAAGTTDAAAAAAVSPAAPSNQSAAASSPSAAGGADTVKISATVSSDVPAAGDRLDSGDSAAGTAVASIAVQPQSPAPPATDTQATPDPVWDTTGSVPPQPAVGSQQASADQGADDLPTPDPIVGPVPLPHPRPRYFALAGMAIPMPRPRPTDAEAAAAPPANDNALGWLGNLFHPAQQ